MGIYTRSMARIYCIYFVYKYKIEYLYPKTPLGRTMYIVSSIFSGIVGFASLSIYNYANNTDHIIEGIVYALIGYSFAVFGLTTFFITVCVELMILGCLFGYILFIY